MIHWKNVKLFQDNPESWVSWASAYDDDDRDWVRDKLLEYRDTDAIDAVFLLPEGPIDDQRREALEEQDASDWGPERDEIDWEGI